MSRPKPKILITLRLQRGVLRALAKIARSEKITRTALIERVLNAELAAQAARIVEPRP